jgi:NAD(P)-dependent dehydrogenase (short-subunit alcohol dehydrogenase family)
MGALDGRRALVTGGASGIGQATARRLAAEGATVAVVDMNEAEGRATAGEIGGGHFVRVDVSDSSEVAKGFATAAELLGGLDIAYLNAGVTTQQGDITQLTDQQYRRIMGVNVDGVVFGAREAARLMTQGGAIVATASIAGLIAYAPDAIYALTKHAVVGLVRGLAPQLKLRNITINAICPGITETPLVGEEGARRLREAGFPLIPPSAIAEAVVQAVTGGGTGDAYVCQPDRKPERYEFRGVPGPRTPGAEGMRPPGG